ILASFSSGCQAGAGHRFRRQDFINHTGADALTPFRHEEIGNPAGLRVMANLATERAGAIEATRRARGGGGDMAAYSEVAGEVRACALHGHRTAALIARVVVLTLALLLALVLISPSRADDGGYSDEPLLPFTIGGGLVVAALGALVLVARRIQDLRA